MGIDGARGPEWSAELQNPIIARAMPIADCQLAIANFPVPPQTSMGNWKLAIGLPLLPHVKIYSKADSLPQIKIYSKAVMSSYQQFGFDGQWLLPVTLPFYYRGLLCSQPEEFFAVLVDGSF